MAAEAGSAEGTVSFRDDRDAMRARIEELERELERDRDRLSRLDDAEAELVRLRARIGQLEAELERFRESPKERAKREQAERRTRQAVEHNAAQERALAQAQKKEAASEDDGTLWSQLTWPRMLGVTVGVTVLGFFGYALCAPPTWTASDAAPSLGVVDLHTTPRPIPVEGTARGSRSSPMGCAGYLPPAPQLVVRTQAPMMVSFTATSVMDTVLVVLAADGTVSCDDDSGGGSNPAVRAALSPGEHRVWVGTYGDGEEAPFSLTISAVQAPDGPIDARGLSPTSHPQHGEARATREAQRFVGSVTPLVSAAQIDARCRGYLDIAPSLVAVLDEWTYVRVDAAGGTDLVLFVEGPGGLIWCDDDSGQGNAPLVAELVEAGRYRVWVGTYASQAGPVPYTLSLAGSPQSRALDPAPRTLTVGASEVVARSPAIVRDSTCGGLVPGAPSAIFDLVTNLDVDVSTTRGGTVLRVEGPGGVRCLAGGSATWLAGRHRVFGVTDADYGEPGDVTLTARPATLLPYDVPTP